MQTRRVTLALAVVAAVLSIASPAHAQCPSGTTDPSQLLFGTWTFHMRGQVGSTQFAAAGQFMASIQSRMGIPVPTLTITQSSSDGSRLQTFTGSFQVFPDCSGGTLTFNTADTSTRPSQFDFWFDEFFTEIRFVSTNSGIAVKGTAEMF